MGEVRTGAEDELPRPMSREELLRRRREHWLTLTLLALWPLSYVAVFVQMPDPDPVLRTLSLLYLVYYFGVSFYVSSRMLKRSPAAWRKRPPAGEPGCFGKPHALYLTIMVSCRV